jgi:phospholipid/cholesterol/gamma-HCH transport system permease protein
MGTGVAIVDGGPTLERIARGNGLALCAAGSWTAGFAAVLEQIVGDAEKLTGSRPNISIDVSRVSKLDTFGAWLIERLRRSLTQGGVEADIAGLSANYASLVEEVRRVKAAPAAAVTSTTVAAMLNQVGRGVVGSGTTVLGLIDMLGAVLAASGRVIARPRGFRLTSTVHHLEQVCWHAVPIVVLITFLIGCIISQQGIFHFRQFGADIFVVDMLGVLVLREIGVLLVAIMVAGRSGSAYTAELGSMKMREEIDALRTMGFDPIEVLILPRMLALIIALPILAFLGAIAALWGGGLVAWLYGGVDPEAFLIRLRDAISIDHFTVGMIKAPVMAAVIGIVACVEGLAVEGSAESLGRHTTSSVVQGIFFVIVMDGVFAIFFASIGM